MEEKVVEAREHHTQHEFCYTRPAYRQGREYKAVKVYTICDESTHLLVQNVPAINLSTELKKRVGPGALVQFRQLPDYPPKEAFTHTFHLQFQTLPQAKKCKKKLDNLSFYGSLLHICYAPELESIEETERKLKERLNFVNSYRRSQSQT